MSSRDAGIVVRASEARDLSSEEEEKLRKGVEKLRDRGREDPGRGSPTRASSSRAPAAVVAKTKQQLEEICRTDRPTFRQPRRGVRPVSVGRVRCRPRARRSESLAPLGGRRFARIQNLILLATAPSTNDLGKLIVEHAARRERGDPPHGDRGAASRRPGAGATGRTWVALPGALALSVHRAVAGGARPRAAAARDGHPPRARPVHGVRDRRAAQVAERSPRRTEEDRRASSSRRARTTRARAGRSSGSA